MNRRMTLPLAVVALGPSTSPAPPDPRPRPGPDPARLAGRVRHAAQPRHHPDAAIGQPVDLAGRLAHPVADAEHESFALAGRHDRRPRLFTLADEADGGGGLVPTLSEVPATKAVATAAMTALLEGPGHLRDAAQTISTAIPPGTKLLGITIADGVATVDLSGEFESGGGSASVFRWRPRPGRLHADPVPDRLGRHLPRRRSPRGRVQQRRGGRSTIR